MNYLTGFTCVSETIAGRIWSVIVALPGRLYLTVLYIQRNYYDEN